MDNHGGDRRDGVLMVISAVHTQTHPQFFQGVSHTLYKTNPRGEQGFYTLSTGKGSSYYDYLYIHTSSYANNLSTSDKIRGHQ